jgi:mono/diheme cytochrome c family protein
LGLLAAVAAGLSSPLPARERDDAAVTEGRSLYLRYCSGCHGETGRGDGIVAHVMRPKPIDLTALAKHAGGTFPFAKVAAAIDGRATVRAHGDPNMPVWGAILTEEEGPALDKETVARTKVVQITAYLETVQAK